MEDLLIRKNLRGTGHVIRMPCERLPKQLLFSQLPAGERVIGRPRLRYKGTVLLSSSSSQTKHLKIFWRYRHWVLWTISPKHGPLLLTLNTVRCIQIEWKRKGKISDAVKSRIWVRQIRHTLWLAYNADILLMLAIVRTQMGAREQWCFCSITFHVVHGDRTWS